MLQGMFGSSMLSRMGIARMFGSSMLSRMLMMNAQKKYLTL